MSPPTNRFSTSEIVADGTYDMTVVPPTRFRLKSASPFTAAVSAAGDTVIPNVVLQPATLTDMMGSEKPVRPSLEVVYDAV